MSTMALQTNHSNNRVSCHNNDAVVEWYEAHYEMGGGVEGGWAMPEDGDIEAMHVEAIDSTE